jgi:hypothetical protein
MIAKEQYYNTSKTVKTSVVLATNVNQNTYIITVTTKSPKMTQGNTRAT